MLVAPGSTSISVDVMFCDDTGAALTGKVAADFPATKWSGGSNTADTTITISDLALITTAHPNDNTAGGVKEREGGVYRLDLPNNMFTAAGRKYLTFAESTNKRIIVLGGMIDCQYTASNVLQFGSSNGTFSGGRPETNLSHWLGTAPLALSSQQVQSVIPTSTSILAVTGSVGSVTATVAANLTQILGSAITGTAAQIVAAFTKFFNVATPTGTVNSLPDATPGNTGTGIALTGSAMALTTSERTTLYAGFWAALTSGLTTVGSIGKWILDKLDVVVSTRAAAGAQMDLVDAPNATALNAMAVEVESHLLDEGDSQMLINAIVGAIGNTNVDQSVLVAAIRADLERSGGNLNTLLARLTSQRATNIDNLDRAISTAESNIRGADSDTLKILSDAIDTRPTLSQIWTTALDEAYRATGEEGTAAELLYEINQHLGNAGIVSDLKTVRKLDGSTTAKQYQLDDADTPTDVSEVL